MTALAFICCVAMLFTAVLAWEATPGKPGLALRPAGLWRWATAGNWTAKLGAVLLAIGTGALLRYLLLHWRLPAEAKLMAGVLIATALGIASGSLGGQPQRRAISVALAGAALAVAYLTAYSAYGFFGFVNSVQALGLLFVVASVATVYAIGRRTLSIAVLGMIGAYIAPAFALDGFGPTAVYGYYVAVSLVTLLMVWVRGWRALIHLSFLFTLAGALFFGWTREFYTPLYYQQMQPLLLMLVGIHLAMPLLEGAGSDDGDRGAGAWLRRFDSVYFLLLPAVAVMLTLVISPVARTDGAIGTLGLALLWSLAAGLQQWRYGSGGARFACVAFCLAAAAGLLALGDVPALLIVAVVSCLVVACAARLALSSALLWFSVTVALASATCYVLQALFEPVVGSPFLNSPFGRHSLLALALAISGGSLRRTDGRFSAVFLTYAAAWLLTAALRELLRLHLEHVPQICHLLALGATGAYALTLLVCRRKASLSATLALSAALFFTGLLGAAGFGVTLLMPLLLAGQVVLLILAHAADRQDSTGSTAGAVARSLLPVVLVPWAITYADGLGHSQADVVLTLMAGSALSASLIAQWTSPAHRPWPNALSPVGFLAFGAILLFETTCYIERDWWAVAFELLALAYLIETARFLVASANRDARFFAGLAIVAVGTVSAAMLLRIIGPPGRLTILALNDLLVPAVVSLLFALAGALLTWFSTRSHSRSQWSVGAALLIAAAVKLVLFDFGSLGQLANILAMIAAGGVFLAVAWLAPFPPKQTPPPGRRPEAHFVADRESDDRAVPDAASDGHSPRASPAPESGGAGSARTAAAARAAAGLWPGGRPAAGPTSAGQVAATSRDSDGAHERGWFWVVCGVAVIAWYVYAEQARVHPRGAVPVSPPASVSSRIPMQVARPAPPMSRATATPGVTPGVVGTPVDNACVRFSRRLPDDYLVYAIGADRPTDSGSEPAAPRAGSGLVDLTVNEPGHTVVLALAADVPTTWRVIRGRDTRIAGVILSGAHHGRVVGLDPSAAVLNAASDDGVPCGSFRVASDDPQGANVFISKLLVHAVDGNFLATDRRLLIGDAPAVAMVATPAGALEIVRATYSSPRNHHSYDVTAKLRADCSTANARCAIACGNQLAADPDPGQRKVCEVSFRCDSGHPSLMQGDAGTRVGLGCR